MKFFHETYMYSKREAAEIHEELMKLLEEVSPGGISDLAKQLNNLTIKMTNNNESINQTYIFQINKYESYSL